MKIYIFLLSIILFTDINCCRSQGSINYSEEQCEILIENCISGLFNPLDEIEFNLLEKSILKYHDTCLVLISDMRSSSCCVLDHYLIARLISSKYNGREKYNYLISLAVSLDTSSMLTATSYSILMNEFLKKYYNSEELVNIFPIEHLSKSVKETITEKVILIVVTQKNNVELKRIFDIIRNYNQDYFFALKKCISFCRFNKFESDVLKNEVQYALRENVLSEFEKSSIKNLYSKFNTIH
ncbi:MAG: hypothetical protein ABI851_05750 [Saprospiraceae bacterium]